MLSAKVYFYYLRKAFKSHRVSGYCVGQKGMGKLVFLMRMVNW